MKKHVPGSQKQDTPAPSPKQGQNPSQFGQFDQQIDRLRLAGNELERAISENYALTHLVEAAIDIQVHNGTWGQTHANKMSGGLFELTRHSTERLDQAFKTVWQRINDVAATNHTQPAQPKEPMDPEKEKQLADLEARIDLFVKVMVKQCQFPEIQKSQDLLVLANRRLAANLRDILLPMLRQIHSILPPDDETRRKKFSSMISRVEFIQEQQDSGLATWEELEKLLSPPTDPPPPN